MSALKDGESFAAKEGVATSGLRVRLLVATEITLATRGNDGYQLLLTFQRSFRRETARCSFLRRPVGWNWEVSRGEELMAESERHDRVSKAFDELATEYMSKSK